MNPTHENTVASQEADQDTYPELRACDLDILDLWRGFGSARRLEFVRYLRALVSDPDTLDALTFCADCGDPVWDDEGYTVNAVGRVCETCWQDYPACERCEESYPESYLTTTLYQSEVCENCRSEYYTYCDHCDGYYNDDDSYEHDHEQGSGCCESPQLQFTVRNDGHEPLANDTRAAFTLPAGTISDTGIKAIYRYLRSLGEYDLAYDLDAIGNQWQTRTGNFAKRLSRHAYQAHQLKLAPEIMSHAGVIAREHSNQVDIEVEVTRDFNQSADYFLHGDSCYWGSYYESRCALKTNGGFGLRTFSDGRLSGRAWVMPMRKLADGGLVPTFDTMTPDAFVVFNGYGDMNGYAPARVMAHMAGWTYRKIRFSCDPIYVNAGGYLVAPEEIAEPYTDGSLHLSVRQHSDLYQTESEREVSYA